MYLLLAAAEEASRLARLSEQAAEAASASARAAEAAREKAEADRRSAVAAREVAVASREQAEAERAAAGETFPSVHIRVVFCMFVCMAGEAPSHQPQTGWKRQAVRMYACVVNPAGRRARRAILQTQHRGDRPKSTIATPRASL